MKGWDALPHNPQPWWSRKWPPHHSRGNLRIIDRWWWDSPRNGWSQVIPRPYKMGGVDTGVCQQLLCGGLSELQVVSWCYAFWLLMGHDLVYSECWCVVILCILATDEWAFEGKSIPIIDGLEIWWLDASNRANYGFKGLVNGRGPRCILLWPPFMMAHRWERNLRCCCCCTINSPWPWWFGKDTCSPFP